MKVRSQLTEKRYVVPFVLITTLFFLWGFARNMLDVLNKHFQNDMGINITDSAYIQVTTYMGYFLMAVPAGMFIMRRGYRQGVVLGLLLFGIGALAFIPGALSGSFIAILAALFVIGCGLTFLETAANPYVTELGPKDSSSSRLNLSQTFNGLGAFLAIFLIGRLLFAGEADSDVPTIAGSKVALPYAVLGGVVLLIAFVFTRVRLPEIEHDEQPVEQKSGMLQVLKNRWFVFGLLALLAYEVAEISINSYFVNFMTGMGWMTDSGASDILSFALVIFMAGRFLGSGLMRYVKAETMLLVCATGTVMCMVLVLLNLGRVSQVALIANYLFEAIMFPTIFSLAVRGLGSLTKSAGALLMMTPIGGCGFLVMAYVADHSNPFLPFFIPLAGFTVVLVYAIRLFRLTKNTD